MKDKVDTPVPVTPGHIEKKIPEMDDEEKNYLMNPMYRKIFAYYALLGNVTNFHLMSRWGFVKFIRDCELHMSCSPVMSDTQIMILYASAMHSFPHLDIENADESIINVPETALGMVVIGMNFNQWIHATIIVFKHVFALQVRMR